jgi:hypothetical protein
MKKTKKTMTLNFRFCKHSMAYLVYDKEKKIFLFCFQITQIVIFFFLSCFKETSSVTNVITNIFLISIKLMKC